MFQLSSPESYILAVAAGIILLFGFILWAFLGNFFSEYKALQDCVKAHTIAITEIKVLEESKVNMLEQIKNTIEIINTKLDRALEEINTMKIEHEKIKVRCDGNHS